MEKKELPENIFRKIEFLSREGDELFDKERDREALAKYIQAIKLLPEPVYEWEAATWLFTAIGDVLWMTGEYKDAYDAFQDALRSPDGIGNPFIHMRVGQLHFELGNKTKAEDELLRAYMGAGKDIFEREDLKYFKLIEQLI